MVIIKSMETIDILITNLREFKEQLEKANPRLVRASMARALDPAAKEVKPELSTPAPKMPSPKEHMDRHAQFADFMPPGKFTKDEDGDRNACDKTESQASKKTEKCTIHKNGQWELTSES